MPDTPEIAADTDALLQAAYDRMMRVEPQLRRFARVIGDLGLPVPEDWATQDDGDRVTFGQLTTHQFDRLLCLLEDIAARRPVQVTITRGGPTLFDPGAPAGPAVRPVASTVHLAVPR